MLSEHTLTQAISLVSLAELDAKIFESVELSSSDIKFLNSVTESYAKKKASAKKRRWQKKNAEKVKKSRTI